MLLPQTDKKNSADLSAFLKKLLTHRQSDGSFPYYSGGRGSCEPTLLALLAMFSSAAAADETRTSLEWVLKLQNADGSIGINPEHRRQGVWLTAQYAVVLRHFAVKDPLKRALDCLCALQSISIPNDEKLRQNNALIGWPWMRGTFGWVEPTAWALIALNLSGLGKHSRAVEGRKLLLDRRIPSGGWNYGNPFFKNKELLPFWDTTSLALLALRGFAGPAALKAGLDYLEKNQEKIESLYGLAWAVLSLQSFGKDVGRLKQKLAASMASLTNEALNAAHFALAIIALSGKKVFIP